MLNANDLEVVFFFQAEDGIRDSSVTGVQTCALPISSGGRDVHPDTGHLFHQMPPVAVAIEHLALGEIWCASDHGHPVPPSHPVARAFVDPRCLSVPLGRKVISQKQDVHSTRPQQCARPPAPPPSLEHYTVEPRSSRQTMPPRGSSPDQSPQPGSSRPCT